MSKTLDSRIEIRLNEELKDLFKFASELKGFKSLSEFIIYCVKSESHKIIKEENEIIKTLRDKKIFVDAILNPDEPTEALKNSYKNYQKMLKNGIGNSIADQRTS